MAISLAVCFSNHCASHSLHHPGKGMYLLAFLLPHFYNFGRNAQPPVSESYSMLEDLRVLHRVVLWLQHGRHRLARTQPLATSTGPMSHKLTLLLINGTKPKPGPRRPRFPHAICSTVNQKAVPCDACSHWTHGSWANMRTALQDKLGNSNKQRTCPHPKLQ